MPRRRLTVACSPVPGAAGAAAARFRAVPAAVHPRGEQDVADRGGKFWYVLGCIAFGASYFAKIPAKKVLSHFGLAEMTSAESFWYVLMCISFGAGYFAKLPTAKAISGLEQFSTAGHAPLAQPGRHSA